MNTLFISGASSGFGKLLAEHALEAGHAVIGTSRSKARLDELAQKYPETFLAVEMDATSDESVAAAIQASHDWKPIDVLVNNAGSGTIGAIEETPMEHFRAVMEVNYFGVLRVIKGFLPHLRENGGKILNVTSVAGIVSYPAFGPYAASKFAVEAISESLRAELAPHNVQVVAIEPGAFATNFVGSNLLVSPESDHYKDSAGQMRQFIDNFTPENVGDPKDVVEVMMKAITADNPPAHAPVGDDAVSMITTKANQLLADIEATKNM